MAKPYIFQIQLTSRIGLYLILKNGRLSITFDRNKVKEFISTKVQATIPNKPINGK